MPPGPEPKVGGRLKGGLKCVRRERWEGVYRSGSATRIIRLRAAGHVDVALAIQLQQAATGSVHHYQHPTKCRIELQDEAR
jgi:hypothetical protein